MQYPRTEIFYVDEVGTSAIHTIEPEASAEMIVHLDERAGFLLTAWDNAMDNLRAFTMAHIRRWGAWDEQRERRIFEDTCYEHYIAKRVERAAKRQGIALDDPDYPHSKETLFARYPNGDYTVWAYQAAWGGWCLARGKQASTTA